MSVQPQMPASLEPREEVTPSVPVPAPASGGLDGRGIAGAALVVMLFFVLSRVTGLAREIVIGAQFGTSADLDAYLAAFRLPDLLFQLVAGGALGSAFIPVFSSFWVKGERAAAWLLFRRIANWMTLALVILCGAAALLADPLTRELIAPGFAPEQQALTADLMRWMLLGSVVFGISGLIMGALNAVQHFLAPAAAPVFYNVAILLAAWLLAPIWGVYGLAAGVIGGALAHFLVQLPALLRQMGAHSYRPGLASTDGPVREAVREAVREVLRLMGPRVLGIFFVQLHFLVNTILASGLSEGSLSALNYAWLLMLLPLGVFAQSVATAAFPTFAAQVAAGNAAEMAATLGRILRTLLFLIVPAAVGLWALRVPLVSALLERGRFDATSTQMVAHALQMYALGLAAHAVLEIVVRAFYALHDTRTPVVVGVAAMALTIVLSLWWVGPLGFGGLALANSAATTVEALALLWLLRGRLGEAATRFGARLGWTLVRALLAAALMAGAVQGWLWWWGGQAAAAGVFGAWIAAGVGMVAAVVVYAGASVLLRSEEVRLARAMLLRR